MLLNIGSTNAHAAMIQIALTYLLSEVQLVTPPQPVYIYSNDRVWMKPSLKCEPESWVSLWIPSFHCHHCPTWARAVLLCMCILHGQSISVFAVFTGLIWWNPWTVLPSTFRNWILALIKTNINILSRRVGPCQYTDGNRKEILISMSS